MSVIETSPADIFGGTWEALNQGRVLIGAGSAHPAGETGGAETVALTAAQMPSHNHSASFSGSSGSSGSHSHSLSGMSINIPSGGSHSHTRGTMNITGSFTVINPNAGSTSGAFSASVFDNHGRDTEVDADYFKSRTISLNASSGWSGSTSSVSHSHSGSISGSVSSAGSHTHSISGTVTIGSTGSGQAHENMPPYLSVYMWKRTA